MRNPGHVNKRSGNVEYGFRGDVNTDSGGMWNADWPGPESLFRSPEWNSEETLIEAGAAGHQRGEVDSTDRWRRPRAPGKGIHAFIPATDPTRPPAINAIPDGHGLSQPQELGLIKA